MQTHGREYTAEAVAGPRSTPPTGDRFEIRRIRRRSHGPDGTLRDFLRVTPIMEHGMGGKASNNLQSNRPESGGADKDMQREKSGLLDRDKERFAAEEAERHAAARAASEKKAESSVDETQDDAPDPASRRE